MKHTFIIAALLFAGCKKECNDNCGTITDNRTVIDVTGYSWEIDYVTECGDTITDVTRSASIGFNKEVGDEYCKD